MAQTTKHGYVFLFDRDTGKPLFPIESRKYPASSVPGEVAAETQPLPVRPRPSRASSSPPKCSPTARPKRTRGRSSSSARCISAGQFIPPSVGKGTIIFPGFDGGAEWGGSAFDPETGLLYVNANEMAWTEAAGRNRQRHVGPPALPHTVRRLPSRRPLRRAPANPRARSISPSRRKPAEIAALIRQGAGRMPAFPNLARPAVDALVQFVMTGEDKELQSSEPSPNDLKYRFTGYNKFLDPGRLPGGRAAVGHAQRHQPEHRANTPGRSRSANIPNWPPKG